MGARSVRAHEPCVARPGLGRRPGDREHLHQRHGDRPGGAGHRRGRRSRAERPVGGRVGEEHPRGLRVLRRGRAAPGLLHHRAGRQRGLRGREREHPHVRAVHAGGDDVVRSAGERLPGRPERRAGGPAAGPAPRAVAGGGGARAASSGDPRRRPCRAGGAGGRAGADAPGARAGRRRLDQVEPRGSRRFARGRRADGQRRRGTARVVDDDVEPAHEAERGLRAPAGRRRSDAGGPRRAARADRAASGLLERHAAASVARPLVRDGHARGAGGRAGPDVGRRDGRGRRDRLRGAPGDPRRARPAGALPGAARGGRASPDGAVPVRGARRASAGHRRSPAPGSSRRERGPHGRAVARGALRAGSPRGRPGHRARAALRRLSGAGRGGAADRQDSLRTLPSFRAGSLPRPRGSSRRR